MAWGPAHVVAGRRCEVRVLYWSDIRCLSTRWYHRDRSYVHMATHTHTMYTGQANVTVVVLGGPSSKKSGSNRSDRGAMRRRALIGAARAPLLLLCTLLALIITIAHAQTVNQPLSPCLVRSIIPGPRPRDLPLCRDLAESASVRLRP